MNDYNALYYESSDIERVVLAETIELPKLMKFPKEKLTFNFLKKISDAGKYYKLIEQEYKDVYGQFHLKVLTPMLDHSEIREEEVTVNSSNIKGSELHTKNFGSSNVFELRIPKYIVMNFTEEIPKGTEFIVASVGGEVDPDKMRIIGFYDYPAEE